MFYIKNILFFKVSRKGFSKNDAEEKCGTGLNSFAFSASFFMPES
ncbi:hypothetical protein B879_01495 [Cecembia lonarensis LW9]|uniref:Uncharacterized protein n=1 Tax=Cecembia lonarensis (strain CCUG 58316 / KCTC 22772 / LW9) TaxID=1225176 RepID=K1L512_CECL9|nr:hypothetical protein B879_01495 [Cecembia lonarensis LW9]